MVSGKEFAEKNFSQVGKTEEKLFSTGNDELDNLLTEVYYSGIEDGYDYAQKEFAKKDENSKLEKSGRGYGTAITNGGVVKGVAAIKAGRKAAKKSEKEGKSESEMIDAAGKKATKVSGILGGTMAVAGSAAAGIGVKKVVGDQRIREVVKSGLDQAGASKEVVSKVKRLGKRAPALVAGAALTTGALIAAKDARRAGDGARKNVTKGLAKSHGEQKEFSKKEDKNTKVVLHLTPRDIKELEREKKKRENQKYKLKPGDSINKAVNYGLMKKDGVLSDLEKDRLEGDTKKNVKNAAIIGGLSGTVYGGAITKIAGGSTKHAIANAGIAGAGIAAASAAGACIGSALRHKIEKGDGKFSKKYKKDWEKQSDLLDLHEGRMTKKEFVKKWGGKIDGKKVKGSKNED